MGLTRIQLFVSIGVCLLLTLVMKTVTGALYTKHCAGSYCPASLLLVWSVCQILGWGLVLVACTQISRFGSKGLIAILLFVTIATIIVSSLGLVNTVPQLEVKTCESNTSETTIDQSVKPSCQYNLLHYVSIIVFSFDILHVIVASLFIMRMSVSLKDVKLVK